MEWLGEMLGSLLAGAGMDINARLGGSIQFFLYDVIKITVFLISRVIFRRREARKYWDVSTALVQMWYQRCWGR